MTPEPMSDEQFKNARLAVQEAWNHWNTHEYIRDRLYDLLHECERLRALQPAMTPEPMSDEIAVLAEVITAGIPKALSRLEAGQFERRADSLIRGFVSSLKAKLSPPIPPDIQAAMESIKNKTHCYAEVYAVALYFADHFTTTHNDEN